jgi:rhodanese-related sulfurtransferase
MRAKDRRLEELRALVPEVGPQEALELQRAGAALVDVREPDEFVQGSPAGAKRLGRGYSSCASRTRCRTSTARSS